MADEVAIRVRIEGRVQGVWFRSWTEERAEALVAGYRLAFLAAAGVASLGVAAALYFFRQAKEDLDT
jgi:hypothetical protein